METTIVAALGAVLLGLMALGIFLAYRAYRKGRKQPQAPPEPSTITAKIDTGKPRPPKVVRAPEGCKEYLTAGKNYTVSSIRSYDESRGYDFYFIDDVGDGIFCCEKRSASLNGGDWIVVEREGEEQQQPSIEKQLFEAQAEATRLAGELEKEKQRADFNRAEFVKQSEMNVELRKQRDEAEEKAKVQFDKFREQYALRQKAEADLLITQQELNRATAELEQLKAKRTGKRGHNGKTAKRDERGRFVQVAKGHPNHRPPKPQPKRKYHENPELIPKPATTEPEIDWTKPVAFPKGYQVPKGIRVEVITENPMKIPVGSKGITMEEDNCPYIDWDGGLYRSNDNAAKKINGGKPMMNYRLAPENPADHPWHRDFKGKGGEK